jgi:hypothetical protein
MITNHTNRPVTNKMKQHGPRGVFLGPRTLRARGLDLKALAYSMGVLHQLAYSSGLSPHDVEYVLGLPPGKSASTTNKRAYSCLYAMDFGMSNEKYKDEYLYSPQDDDPELFQQFEMGKELVNKWQRSRSSQLRRTPSMPAARRRAMPLRRFPSARR